MHKNSAKSLLERALAFQGAGRITEAANIYRQILLSSPNQPDALHFLGMIAHRTGNLDEAVRLIAESLKVNPNNAGALNNLAGVLKDQRRFDESLEFYQAAISVAPHDARLHSNLGNLFKEMNRLEEAVGCYGHALELDPKSYAAYCNLGTVLQMQGDLERALECYRRAQTLNPREPQILTNMGAVYNDMGRFADAVRCHELALKIEPNSEAAHCNLGASLREMGRSAEAIESCWRALKINPRSHLSLNNLGNALKDQRRFAEAAACLQKALELRPDCYLTYTNLGNVLKEAGMMAEGLACMRKAVELKSDCPMAWRNLASLLYDAGQAREAVSCFRKALELKPDSAATFSDLLYTLNYLPRDNPEELFAEHLQFGRKFCDPLLKLARPHSNAPDPQRKLRVGYVSGDLREHPVVNFIEPVFVNRSREAFEVFCYANHRVEDAVSERLKTGVDRWRNISALSDEETAGLIRKDGIDILVDLSGHTALNRLLVFARKPAPVQVTMIGYMQTTGMVAMDYRITDATLDPIGTSERWSTEKLVRLPAGAAPFQPPRDCPEVNDLPALQNGCVTFASFNNLAKVTAEVIETWAEVLKAVPDSKLLVVGRDGGAVGTAMESFGIGKDRLEILPRQPMRDYLALHHRVDFVLDAFPYNGGTTNLIAAWMGVPFVTIAGSSTISRVGEGVLKAAGLPQLVAADRAEYVQKAADAVGNLERLARWRAAMRPRLEPWVNGGPAFTRQLECAFREMWRQWCGQNTDSAAA